MPRRVHPRPGSSAKRSWLSIACASVILYVLTIPGDIFGGVPYSTVVLSREGDLLGARIAADGQWRFRPASSVPEKYAEAVIQLEDKHFRHHPGVNPVSIIRAARMNIRSGKVVSGGSTLTMQLIRLSDNAPRTLPNKIVEAFKAVRLEMSWSKKKILAQYAAHAPFGGNVVGLEAACRRYFGHAPEEMTWAEAATLAVLPNNPSYIHVGRNRDRLMEKRNRLLQQLHAKGLMEDSDLELALEEPLPEAPNPLPSMARSTVDRFFRTAPGQTVSCDLDFSLQSRLETLADRWNDALKITGVNDLAAVIIDVETGRTVACVGNAHSEDGRPGAQVDISTAPRSTGSILKPFLYCAMLQDGGILPHTLLPDIPVNINGFAPRNFDRSFCGAIPASEAVARSLNVPAVHMLREFGVPKFMDILKEAGLTTLDRPADVYGLSLILGGAEGRLTEITRAYAAMSAVCQGYGWAEDFPLTDRVALYHTFDALKEVGRPDEMDWRLISSVRKVAWKTGTSYGFRDAWAVGVTPRWAVGVWAGNAGGEGVSGLVGARVAGPVLFDILNFLPDSGWFEELPGNEGIMASVCRSSGRLAGPYCELCDTILLPEAALRSEGCSYHRQMPDGSIAFLLPPSMEWYYRQRHPEYKTPPIENVPDGYSPMQFIYPESGAVISIPRQLDGSIRGATFNLAHTVPGTKVFWHLDSDYIGFTSDIHQMGITAAPGRHTVTVVDAQGHSLSVLFYID